MRFAEIELSIERGFEDGGDGAEKLAMDRYDLRVPSDGNVHNSLEKMPVQGVRFLGSRRPERVPNWKKGLSKIPCGKNRGRFPGSRNTSRRLQGGGRSRGVFRDIIYINELMHARQWI